MHHFQPPNGNHYALDNSEGTEHSGSALDVRSHRVVTDCAHVRRMWASEIPSKYR